ncbi:MAG: helix-turn-helix transcriptional regulator [bacterium]|nr:helix-turn-helix transcriptional regulator [bacterium]
MTVEFGHKLKNARGEEPKSRLAERLGLHHSTLSVLEAAKREPSGKLAYILLQGLAIEGAERPRFLLSAAGLSEITIDALLDVGKIGKLHVMDMPVDALLQDWENSTDSEREELEKNFSLVSQVRYYKERTIFTTNVVAINSGYADASGISHLKAGDKKLPGQEHIKGLLYGLQIPPSARAAFVLIARGHSLNRTLTELSHVSPVNSGELQPGIVTQLPTPR